MLTSKQLEMLRHAETQQQQVIVELNALTKDIDRGERNISAIKTELEAVNVRFQGPRTTRDDIAYLTALLQCAKKKLAWEKQMASLQKRAPLLLESMTRLINDPDTPPADPMRAEMLRALQGVQAALERLEQVKVA